MTTGSTRFRLTVLAALAVVTMAGCSVSSSGGSGPETPSIMSTPLLPRPAGTPAAEPNSHGMFVITSEAMAMTLQGCRGCVDDQVMVSSVGGHSNRLRNGDIVAFHGPPGWRSGSGALVLRVIAMGGETVKGVATDGGQNDTVMLSEHGTAGPWRTLNESQYVYIDAADARANFGPVTVPAGRVWVMGDHRNDALDSREHCGPRADLSNLTTCDAVSSTVRSATSLASQLGEWRPPVVSARSDDLAPAHVCPVTG